MAGMRDPNTRAEPSVSHPRARLNEEDPMRNHLAAFMLRIKAKHQTRFLMRRYRVWYIDSPQAVTVDRWWKPAHR